MRRGDVVLIAWPFTDLSTAKVRPAVVVSSDEVNRGEDRILVKVSSAAGDPARCDVVVLATDAGFPKTGLRCTSTIQCGKLLTVSTRIIRRRLGTATSLMPQIERGIKHALGLR
jgi:mRNA interferase MazF